MLMSELHVQFTLGTEQPEVLRFLGVINLL